MAKSKMTVRDRANEHHVRELTLYADNTSELQPQRNAIIVNLARKLAAGKYDSGKAWKLWKYWFDSAAQSYTKEFGGSGHGSYGSFSAADREQAAKDYAIPMLTMLMDGEFDHLLTGIHAKRMAAKRASGEYRQPINAPPRKNPRRSRKKNPAPAFVIALYMGTANKRLTYDATRNRFTDNSKPSLYATQIAAKNRAEVLLQNNKMLTAYRVTVEPATAKERGSVFGARPRRQNPKDRAEEMLVFPSAASAIGGVQSIRWNKRFATITQANGHVQRVALSKLPKREQWTAFNLADAVYKHGKELRPKKVTRRANPQSANGGKAELTSLWKYNRVTGIWNHVRGCNESNCAQWLAVFQRDEPDEFFRLSPRKPTDNPERKKNPSTRSHETEIEAAAKLHADFSGHEAENVDTVRDPGNQVFANVGTLDGVLYTATRDGKAEKYIHRFRRKSRPLLAASHDGTELRILGGEFRFTEAGIVDE